VETVVVEVYRTCLYCASYGYVLAINCTNAMAKVPFAANSSEIGFHSSAVTGHDSTSSAFFYDSLKNFEDKKRYCAERYSESVLK